jgi:catechol 2,3-dioxygenase-like lactoylglutathione lyase family enzyme
MNFIRLNQIFLPVIHLDNTTNWYIEHFNMTLVGNGLHEGNPTKELSFAKTSFFLVENAHVNTYTHIPFNFHTNRVSELHDQLTKEGIIVTELTNDDGVFCCDFYDPEGNRIGLCYEGNNNNPSHFEVGGTFLTVRDLNEAVKWYQENLDYEFEFFQATGAAGVIGPTPALMPELTIYYAGVSKASFQNEWSRICLVETPEFNPLNYKPYNILSSNIEEDYELLRMRGVEISDIAGVAGNRRFSFWDRDRNEIEIVEQ